MPIGEVNRDDSGEVTSVYVDLPTGRAKGLWLVELKSTADEPCFEVTQYEPPDHIGCAIAIARWAIPAATMAERFTVPIRSSDIIETIPPASDREWQIDNGSEFERSLASLMGWRMAKAVARRFSSTPARRRWR